MTSTKNPTNKFCGSVKPILVLVVLIFALSNVFVVTAASDYRVDYDFEFYGENNNQTCVAKIKIEDWTETYAWPANTLYANRLRDTDINNKQCEGSFNVAVDRFNTTVVCATLPEVPACPACPATTCTMPEIPACPAVTCSEIPAINVPSCPEYNFTNECKNVVIDSGITQRELIIGIVCLAAGAAGMYFYLMKSGKLVGGGSGSFNFAGNGSVGNTRNVQYRQASQYVPPQLPGPGQGNNGDNFAGGFR